MFLMELTVLAGCAAAAPDPASWQPASIAGPALFAGQVTDIEEFRNPPDVDYACHAVMSGPHKNRGGCISNACGLERITIKTEQMFRGNVSPKVSLNRIVGEWCEGVSVTGRKFLIAVLPDGNWSAFEVISDNERVLALPDFTGCLGKIGIPALLQTAGVDIDSATAPAMAWRSKWTPAISDDCPQWMPESLDKKALAIDTVVAAWKAIY